MSPAGTEVQKSILTGELNNNDTVLRLETRYRLVRVAISILGIGGAANHGTGRVHDVEVVIIS